MSHWYDDPHFVQRVHRHARWFYRNPDSVADGIKPPVELPPATQEHVTRATKLIVKDIKFLLGYLKVFQLWGRGVDQRFIDRMHHPTMVGKAATARGIKRRRARRTLAISPRGVEFIANFEGYFANWYRDPVGVLTIGYGHTHEHLPSWAKPPLSRATARRLLDVDLDQYEAGVRQAVKVPLTQGQFDALVSFAYNVGVGGLGGSTLLRKLNAGDYRGAADEFLKWDKAGGRVLPGLTRRRRDERAMFLG